MMQIRPMGQLAVKPTAVPSLRVQHAAGQPVRFGATLVQDVPYVIDFSVPISDKSVSVLGEVLQKMAYEKRLTKDSGSIKLLINCPGGSVTEGFKLIGLMRQLEAPVDTVVMGVAASMGAILALTAASPGRRFMDRHAKLMIHQPSITELSGTAEEVANYSQELTKTRNILDSLISQNTGLPMDKVRQMTSKDTFVTPLRALKDGFVDWVIVSSEKGLNRQAIKGLSDAEIDRRDQYNQYDDLPLVKIDPKLSNPRIPQAWGNDGIAAGALPAGKSGNNGPSMRISIGEEIKPREGLITASTVLKPEQAVTRIGATPITRIADAGDASRRYRPRLEIIA
jgi:ATP-dependent Clp protease, protease subunit